MRSFHSFLFATAALLSGALVSNTHAGEIVVHLPEDAPAGQTIGDLRELLQLAPTEHVRLDEGSHKAFRIDSRERLVVAPRARLDHESQPEHRLRVVIVDDPDGRTNTDPLQSRFSELLTDLEDAEQPSDGDGTVAVRTATIRVLIDDAPEPPLLLGSSFRFPSGTTPQAGQRIGRAIVIDLDRQEQHHFELLDGGAYLRIDPRTGELFLRDDVNPLSVAMLRAVVRVTDRTGLSAQASYPVWLSENPPAPPLPVLLVETEDRASAEDATRVESAATATSPSTTSPEPEAPGGGTETASSAVAATLKRSHSGSVPPLPSSRTAPSGGPAGLSWTRGWLSTFGPGEFDEHRAEWLIVASVVMCVVVIVISGVRNAVLAGRETVDSPAKHRSVSTSQQQTTGSRAIERDPHEISEILERLDAVIGRSEHAPAAVETEADTVTSVVSATSDATATGTDAMPPVEAAAPTATVPARDDESAQSFTAFCAADAAEEFATTEAATGTEQSTRTQAPPVTAESALAVATDPEPKRQRTATDEERERIEQFREISRMMNRADIGRHSRERRRDEWMSIGVTSLACVVTGTVCVFTSCFATMSVPIGSVMFSVAAVLLMRPSLYVQFSRHDTAATQSGDGVRHRMR
jgi:hypothetical protein